MMGYMTYISGYITYINEYVTNTIYMSFQRVSVLKVAGSAKSSFSRPQGESAHLEPSWRGSFGRKRNKCSSRNISHGKTRQLCCTKLFKPEPENVIGEEFCDGVSALPLLVALLVCFWSWWGGQVCHFSGTSNTNGEHLTAKTLRECRTALTITLLNYLLILFVLFSFCLFIWTSLWSNVWRVWSLKTHYFCPNFKVPLTDWLSHWPRENLPYQKIQGKNISSGISNLCF